jgi:hypothetical protein
MRLNPIFHQLTLAEVFPFAVFLNVHPRFDLDDQSTVLTIVQINYIPYLWKRRHLPPTLRSANPEFN